MSAPIELHPFAKRLAFKLGIGDDDLDVTHANTQAKMIMRLDELLRLAAFVDEVREKLGVYDDAVRADSVKAKDQVTEKIIELQQAQGRAEAYEREWTPAPRPLRRNSFTAATLGGPTPILAEPMRIEPTAEYARLALLIELAADAIPRQGRPTTVPAVAVWEHAVATTVDLIDRAHAIVDPVAAAEQANLDAAAAEG